MCLYVYIRMFTRATVCCMGKHPNINALWKRRDTDSIATGTSPTPSKAKGRESSATTSTVYGIKLKTKLEHR